MAQRDAWGAWVVLALGIAAGCSGSANRGPRPDMTPTTRLLRAPVPAGVAETALVVGSTEATPGAPAGTSNLVWVVASETREYDYAVATCQRVRVQEPVDDELARAQCDDDEYAVVVGREQLELRRGREPVSSFSLPAGWRARALAPDR